jgi:hypothetical protein
MKPHEPKNRDKTRAKKKGETKGDKKSNQKRRKCNKTLSQKKMKRGSPKLFSTNVKFRLTLGVCSLQHRRFIEDSK